MEHSATAYLKRLPTETLEDLLQNYNDPPQQDYFPAIIDEVLRELSHRKTAVPEQEASNHHCISE